MVEVVDRPAASIPARIDRTEVADAALDEYEDQLAERLAKLLVAAYRQHREQADHGQAGSVAGATRDGGPTIGRRDRKQRRALATLS